MSNTIENVSAVVTFSVREYEDGYGLYKHIAAWDAGHLIDVSEAEVRLTKAQAEQAVRDLAGKLGIFIAPQALTMRQDLAGVGL